MNKKQSIFSLGLLREGFRQCQMIGILSMVIMVLGALFIPIGCVINVSNDPYYVTEAWDAWGANPLLLIVLLAAPLMTLTLFHFLDNRAASDLYHAMPHKRITLYLSYAGAILLWVVLLMAVSTVVSLISCAITHQYIILLYDTILPYLCSIFLICALTISGILIAMSLTGTAFTNVLFSAILLFLPRLCIYFLSEAVTGSMPFIAGASESNSFFRSSNNLLFSLISTILDIDISNSVINVFKPGWQAMVYTLLLALIYFAVGAWLFCRRRSEAAGQSAPSRMLQNVYRIVVTMTYCIFVTAALHSCLELGLSGDDWFVFLILYIIALLIYFTYELITTKKWRNLLRAMPGLAVLAVLNGGILLGMHVAQERILDQRPSVQEIESVSFRSSSNTVYQGAYLEYGQYVDLESQKIEITDPTVISLVSYYLNENIETWEKGQENYFNKYYNYSGAQAYTDYIVTIRTKKDTLYRSIMIPNSEANTLIESLQSNEEFVKAWMTPPEPVENTMFLETYIGDDDFDVEALYESYIEELKTVPFEKFYEKQTAYIYSSVSFGYTFRANGYNLTISCPIYADLMPETLQKYYDMLYDSQADSRDTLLHNANINASLNINAYGRTVNDSYKYADCYEEADSQPLSELECYQLLLEYAEDRPVQVGEAYAEVWLYPYVTSDDETYSEIYVILPLSDDFFSDTRVNENFDTGYYDDEN
ncbi:MAG: hypothetical protein ACI4XB_02985 [Ruminococcus sp.]